MSTLFETTRKGATLSPCGTYRYELWRVWDESKPTLLVVMLNPSKADAEVDDPTIKKVVKFARAWGYGGIVVVNLYALRSTDPDELLRHASPVAPPDDPCANDRYIRAAAAGVRVALVAWGSHKTVKARRSHVEQLLADSGVELVCLRKSKDGLPWHPLYVFDSQPPMAFSAEPHAPAALK